MSEFDELDGEEIQEVINTDTQENTPEEKESETVIYTGPNLYAMALQRFQVFRGGLPPHVKRAIEKIPEIASLIVPVDELEAMRQKIDRSGTNESRLFGIVEKHAAQERASRKKAR